MKKFALFCALIMLTSTGFCGEIPSRYNNLTRVKLNEFLSELQAKNESEKENYLASIKYLDASWHQLDKLNFLPILEQMPNLQVLDLSHNEISNISKGEFGYMTNLKRLDLSHNRLTRMNNFPFEQSLAGVVELNVSHNSITFGVVPTNEGIISLDFSNNDLKELDVRHTSTLQFLNLSNNRFKIRKSHSALLENLMYLDLTANGLEELDLNEIDFPKLNTLILHKNPISEIPREINERIQLKELDISETNIERLFPIPSLRKLTCGGRHDYRVSDGREMSRAQLIRKKKKEKIDNKLTEIRAEAEATINPFDLKPIVDSVFGLVELSILREDKENFSMIFDHPNLTGLRSLSLIDCSLKEFPDLNNFPKLKRLDLFDNRIHKYPNGEQLTRLNQLDELNVGLRIFGFIRGKIKKLGPLDIMKLREELSETQLTYYNEFINRNCTTPLTSSAIVAEFSNETDKTQAYYKMYKALENSDRELALVALETALVFEKENNPCSERQFLMELSCIEIAEGYLTAENRISISLDDGAGGKTKVKGSLVFSRYMDLYNFFDSCDFENEQGLGKVKAKMYEAYMNIVRILEAEYAARQARIQRLINGVGTAGKLGAVGAGLSAGTFNNNIAAAGLILNGISDWAANTAEERARYLMDINKRLGTEIVEFKQMANSFLD